VEKLVGSLQQKQREAAGVQVQVRVSQRSSQQAWQGLELLIVGPTDEGSNR
jgi:hypothetical protein